MPSGLPQNGQPTGRSGSQAVPGPLGSQGFLGLLQGDLRCKYTFEQRAGVGGPFLPGSYDLQELYNHSG